MLGPSSAPKAGAAPTRTAASATPSISPPPTALAPAALPTSPASAPPGSPWNPRRMARLSMLLRRTQPASPAPPRAADAMQQFSMHLPSTNPPAARTSSSHAPATPRSPCSSHADPRHGGSPTVPRGMQSSVSSWAGTKAAAEPWQFPHATATERGPISSSSASPTLPTRNSLSSPSSPTRPLPSRSSLRRALFPRLQTPQTSQAALPPRLSSAVRAPSNSPPPSLHTPAQPSKWAAPRNRTTHSTPLHSFNPSFSACSPSLATPSPAPTPTFCPPTLSRRSIATVLSACVVEAPGVSAPPQPPPHTPWTTAGDAQTSSPATSSDPASASAPPPHSPVPDPSIMWVCIRQQRASPSCPAYVYLLPDLHPAAAAAVADCADSASGAGAGAGPAPRVGEATLSAGSATGAAAHEGAWGESGRACSGGGAGPADATPHGVAGGGISSPWSEGLLDRVARALRPAATLTGRTFAGCGDRAGPWCRYRLRVVTGEFGVDEADVLFPNCLVLEEEAASHSHQPHHPVQQRTLHNAATTLHVCDWLADPTRERLQCHLLNLATMRLHASWEEVAEAGPGGQREGASMDASCSTDGEREVFVAGALGAGGRGGGSSQRWSSGSWCYSRLEQTWGPHALRTLGITRRSVTQFLLELQVQKEQGLPLVGDKECLLTRGAAE